VAPAKFSHYRARERWGEPDEWTGSVNEPRTREEHGVRFNERWIYFLPDGVRRLVYWHRYDFCGALLEAADGSLQEESI
jgi:hypothetical protein